MKVLQLNIEQLHIIQMNRQIWIITLINGEVVVSGMITLYKNAVFNFNLQYLIFHFLRIFVQIVRIYKQIYKI